MGNGSVAFYANVTNEIRVEQPNDEIFPGTFNVTRWLDYFSICGHLQQ